MISNDAVLFTGGHIYNDIFWELREEVAQGNPKVEEESLRIDQ